MKADRPDWTGQTVACLASGPSLTPEDVETIRGLQIPTIVTNTTFRLAPWADVLFGFDFKWWQVHIAEVRETFKGRRLVCMSELAVRLGVAHMQGSEWFRGAGNSGSCAISYAIGAGARRVILLGYDACSGADGRKHWHGDHPKTLSNCVSMGRWPGQFQRAAAEAKQRRVEVLNCSRRTALQCFPPAALEDVVACN